jgi:hypothetical protein
MATEINFRKILGIVKKTSIYLPLIDPDAQAFIDAAGITNPTQQEAINTLVTDLKNCQIWTKMKAIYPFVGGTSTTHKFNLKNPLDTNAAFRIVFSGGWTHSSTGATPNGVNGTADTFLNENTTLILNNEHISIYLRTNTATLAGDIGAFNTATFQSNILPRFSDGLYGRIHATSGIAAANTDSRGFYVANRTNANDVFVYKTTTKYTVASTVTGKVNDTFIFGRRAKTEGVYSDREIAFSTIGDGLTDAEEICLYNAIQTFQTTLGRSIGTQTVSDADAQAFVTAADIQDQVQADAVNNLTIGLKTNNIWSKMIAIYPFVGGTSSTHKWNLKNPVDSDAAFRLIFNGGITHNANGVTFNGTNGWADTKMPVNTVLTLDNTHTSLYSRTNNAIAAVDMGCAFGANDIRMHLKWNDNNGYHDMYDTGTNRITYNMSATASTGLFVANRTSNVVFNLWRNSTKLTTNTNLRVSTFPPKVIIIGADNGNAYQFFSNRNFAFASIGLGLSDTEATNFYTVIQAYQTALSRQI